MLFLLEGYISSLKNLYSAGCSILHNYECPGYSRYLIYTIFRMNEWRAVVLSEFPSWNVILILFHYKDSEFKYQFFSNIVSVSFVFLLLLELKVIYVRPHYFMCLILSSGMPHIFVSPQFLQAGFFCSIFWFFHFLFGGVENIYLVLNFIIVFFSSMTLSHFPNLPCQILLFPVLFDILNFSLYLIDYSHWNCIHFSIWHWCLNMDFVSFIYSL